MVAQDAGRRSVYDHCEPVLLPTLCTSDAARHALDDGAELTTISRNAHCMFCQAKAKSKLFIPPEFPDPHVAQAYLEPTVDESTEPFVLATPDLDGLRRYPLPARGTEG